MPESEIAPTPQKRSRYARIGWMVVKWGLIVLVIASLLRYFVAEPFIVSGSSMEPTFTANEYLAIDRLTYRFDPPQRGDVIVFHYPLDPSLYFIKRIVGLPGETVKVVHGAVTVVSEAGVIEETHAATHASLTDQQDGQDAYTTRLAGDEYFVLGDNFDVSDDSRKWGPLQKEFIIGRPIIRLWPLAKMGFLPGATDIAE